MRATPFIRVIRFIKVEQRHRPITVRLNIITSFLDTNDVIPSLTEKIKKLRILSRISGKIETENPYFS